MNRDLIIRLLATCVDIERDMGREAKLTDFGAADIESWREIATLTPHSELFVVAVQTAKKMAEANTP